MLTITKLTTLRGQSMITGADGVNKLTASMNASVDSAGNNLSINRNINDTAVYIANIEECKKDMSEFDDMLDALLIDKIDVVENQTDSVSGSEVTNEN